MRFREGLVLPEMTAVRTYRMDLPREAAFKNIHVAMVKEMRVKYSFESRGVVLKLSVDSNCLNNVLEKFRKVKVDFRRWPIVEEEGVIIGKEKL